MKIKNLIYSFCLLSTLVSCAKMGNPDGGMYDETPPKIIGASPQDKSSGVNTRKINIYFDEFIKIENASEKVVVSPPQIEQPDIKTQGKKIVVNLKDSLKPNTTYTIDFSDAISDNNEGNPLGNYTYSFSTYDQIDTFEVSGSVLESENLEPIKGILVGLYNDLSDTAFIKKPLMRVSRTDSRGHFVIKGIAPGSYRIYALNDADGDYRFSQKGEKIAYSHSVITPSCTPAIRQDTTWRDSLHIDTIKSVPYIRFMPDDLTLLAFNEIPTDRYFIKGERKEANKFTLYFSYGDNKLPKIRGLNFNENNAFITEASNKKDTITYWLRDTMLCNQDTLNMELQYAATDSTGALYDKTDTVQILSKDTYARRIKQKTKAYEEWKKEQDKAKKKGDPYETAMKPEALEVRYNVASDMAPNNNIEIIMPAPLSKCDSSAIHLYSKHDSLWYKSPFIFREKAGGYRTYQIIGEWRPGIEYSLEIDSAAFISIYGKASLASKQGFKIKPLESFSSLFITLEGVKDTTAIVQLLNKSDDVVSQQRAKNGHADFYYLKPDTYFMRVYFDSNNNGKWDTGKYSDNLQPERVNYYPKEIECKAQWDVSRNWNPNDTRIDHQKPGVITKQKPEKAKQKKNRNAERAAQLGK